MHTFVVYMHAYYSSDKMWSSIVLKIWPMAVIASFIQLVYIYCHDKTRSLSIWLMMAK